MTGKWSVCVPEAGTNLVKNPSIEINTTGHAATGSTISRDTTYSRFGYNSLKVVTSDAGASEGVIYNGGGGTAAMPVTIGNSYTFSDYLRGSGTVYLGIYWYTTSGSVFVSLSLSSAITLSNTRWTRYTVTATAPATSDYAQLRVITTAQQAATFWCDGFQFEGKAYATTYIDGDQPGCRWTGLYHASTSTRDANYRLGGRIVDIEDTYGIRIRNMSGAGVPPLNVLTQEIALQPGSIYLNDKYEERALNLIMEPYSTSMTGLHSLRKSFYDVIKPEAYGNNDPFLLAYTGNSRTVYGAFRYAGGWGLGEITGGKYQIEQSGNVGLRLIANDPFWYEDDQQTAALDFTDSIASNNYAAARISGDWVNLGTGFNAAVNCIAVDHSLGRVYFGGTFTTANGVTVNGITYWNGTTFVAMTGAGGTGVSGGAVLSISIAPNNDVWIGGVFTSCDGAAADGLARWNYATSTYTKFTNGTPGDAFNAIAIDKNGLVYLAGNFTNWDGNANEDYIVSYNGSAFAALSTGTNGVVWSLAIGADGTTLYIGGDFTTPQTRIMSWNGSAFAALGSGASNSVLTLAVSENGVLYAGGVFSSTPTSTFIASWNGSSWSSLGSGANATVTQIVALPNGELYVIGIFTTVGGISTTDRVAIWNGTSWHHGDFIPDGSSIMNSAASLLNDVYIGHSASGTATSSGLTSVTNTCTTITYPVITIAGPSSGSATLQWLENQTTGQLMYFNLVILPGEVITIDLRTGSKSVNSSWRGASISSNRGTLYFTSGARGRIFDNPLPNSDFSNWKLVPGANTIAAFISGTTTGVTMTANWQVSHSSIDGASA